MKYFVDVYVRFEVDAENVAVARDVSRRIRTIGEVMVGYRKPRHNRQSIAHRIRKVDESVSMPRRVASNYQRAEAK